MDPAALQLFKLAQAGGDTATERMTVRRTGANSGRGAAVDKHHHVASFPGGELTFLTVTRNCGPENKIFTLV